MAQESTPPTSGTLDLDDLSGGQPGISPIRGAAMAEAAAICLETETHDSGVPLNVDGDFTAQFNIEWLSPNCGGQVTRAWGDPQEATEHGATGIAAAVIPILTGLKIVERSKKGTGFDYWLGDPDGDDDNFLKNTARLEVSGIQNGKEAEIRARVKKKEHQTAQSDETHLPAYIAVVEFGTPRSRVKKR